MKTVSLPVGNVSVQLIAEDDRIVRVMNSGKQWELKTRGVWQELVKPGWGVIDVGAYTGVYSIASALMGAWVIAFEPHAANFERLERNAVVNGVPIRMLKAAATDQCQPIPLRANKPCTVINDIASCEGEAPMQELVSGVTIDSFNLRAVGLIKIDVEGHEMKVLNGAAKTIHACHPHMIIEVLGEETEKAVAQYMAQQGYGPAVVIDTRNRLYRA